MRFKSVKGDKTVIDNSKKYHVPGCQNFQKRSVNSINLSSTNTVRHEMAKCLGAYMLNKIGDVKFNEAIIKALRDLDSAVSVAIKDFPKNNHAYISEVVPNKEPERRIDLVDLSTDTRFEFETNPKIKKENAVTIYL